MKTQTSSLEIPHFPVMLSEIIKIASPSKGGLYIDCTFGGGGYTKAFLKFSKVRVIGFDIDQEKCNLAKELGIKTIPLGLIDEPEKYFDISTAVAPRQMDLEMSAVSV